MRDFLKEIIAERAARNEDFPRLVAEAEERRARLRDLARQRGGRLSSHDVLGGRRKRERCGQT